MGFRFVLCQGLMLIASAAIPAFAGASAYDFLLDDGQASSSLDAARFLSQEAASFSRRAYGRARFLAISILRHDASFTAPACWRRHAF